MQDSRSLLLNRFEALGLSRNEGLVYLALLTYAAPTTGYYLSKDHNILRPVAYEMLNRLVERGGARIIKGKSDLYSPIAPDTFLSLLERRFNEARRELAAEIHALQQADQSQADREFFWNINGFDVIIAEVQALALKAQKSILFYFNDPRCSVLLKDAFSKKAGAGVSVLGFSYRDLDLPGAEIYSYGLPPEQKDPFIPEGRIIIVADGEQSLMGDLEKGAASISSSSSQVETVSDFIRSKISLYRMAQMMEPGKLSLYLFEEERRFLNQLREQQ